MGYRPVELCPYGFDAEDKKPVIHGRPGGRQKVKRYRARYVWWLNSEGPRRASSSRIPSTCGTISGISIHIGCIDE